MNRRCFLALAALLAIAIPARAQNAPQQLSHDVYFSLNDASPAARAALVAACKKYLTGHEGTVAFSAGVLASELDRAVNDRDFDVALHITFASRAAHDKYQEARVTSSSSRRTRRTGRRSGSSIRWSKR